MKRLERHEARKRRKTRTFLKVLLTLILLGGLVVGMMKFDEIKIWASQHYFSLRMGGTTITQDEEPDLYAELSKWHDPAKPLNVLFIGIDRGSVVGEDGNTRSDVMILLSLNVEKKKAVLVSIPRDTKVTLPSYGIEKINAAHSFNGPAGAVEAVKKLSGMEINDYAEVDFEAFKGIVDAIGGVPFHLEHTINDPKAGYLPKGDYNLDGKGALIVCRSRELPRGDLDRIENQKQFLKAVMEKAVNIRDIQTLLGILDAAVQHLQTTLEPDMIFTLARMLQGMKVEDVQFATIPGDAPDPKPGQPWYFIYDEKATAQLFSNISNYSSIRTPQEEAALQAQQQQQQQAVGEEDRSSIGLTVLNGARWDGLAANVAATMQDKGYQNIKTGNSSNAYSETTVYYAAGHEADARAVASDLDPNKTFRITQDAGVTGTNKSDVVLVLGKDYVST
jgi:polyisoprenyl-teichoic acid--peptidoglycan teichoic acid transferase